MKEIFKNLNIVYKYSKSYKKYLIYTIIGSIIGITISITIPILAANQIVYFTNNTWKQLLFMSLVILIVNIINEAKTVLIRKNTQKFTIGVTEKMQKELSKEILKINQSEIDINPSGTFISRITSDVSELSNMFTVGLGRLVGIISSIGTFISVFIINKYVFLFYITIVIILTILHLIKTKKFRKEEIKKRKQFDKLTSITSELIRGSRDIKMLNIKNNFVNLLNQNVKLNNKLYVDVRNIDINYNFFINTLSSLFEFILIILLIILVKNNALSVAFALALYSYRSTLMINFMEKIGLLLSEINTFNIAFNRVFSILNSQDFKKEKFGTKKITNIKGEFEFKNVSFSYNDKTNILDNFNLKISANKTYGIIGKSGAGKTTIFNLLCKMYDIKEGTISIDGINIDKLDEDSIRGNITIISQNPYIFNLSIKDNLKLVKPNLTDNEMYEACNLACLNEFIESLPHKYDTLVGEGGVSLSGGQRQRLAIARALIQKTKIILFDEATSALDNQTQNDIQNAINNLKEDYTIVIIAHRLSTIKKCDKIFFMKDGKIIESGTHKQLLENCKSYKQLYEYEIEQ